MDGCAAGLNENNEGEGRVGLVVEGDLLRGAVVCE